MGFYQEYELLGLVHDGPTKTLRAREIATDRPVFLHLLTGALAPDAQRSLLEQVQQLIVQSTEVLKVGEFAGTRYVVTEVLDPFSNLEIWVEKRMSGAVNDGGPGHAPPEAPRPAETLGAGGSASPPENKPSVVAPAEGQPGSSAAGHASGSGTNLPPAQPDALRPAASAESSPAATAQVSENPAESETADHSQPGMGRAESQDQHVEREPAPASHTTAVADTPSEESASPPSGEDFSINGSATVSGETVSAEQGLRELTESLHASPSETAAQPPSPGVEEHLDQARQHLGNDAIRNALDSLETALKLRPDHPEALRLVDEAKRIERDQQAGEEVLVQKEWHYKKARDLWEEGDLEATLDELDRLAELQQQHPSPDTDRNRVYADFQRQVHAESEALSNSYAEARAQLADENLEAALSICDRYLAKFPNHALFQALRFDIGERKRQEALAFIADTDRQVDAEPDLDRRIKTLEQALQRYPGEKHFEESIRLIREKQQLVSSIVDKAGSMEQSQRFREALDQWQLVESIHAQLPGLQDNIKRLEQRIAEQRIHLEARTRWVSQSKRCLQAGDYEQALRLVRNALVECPDDAELRQLELEAGQGLQRADGVRDHLRQAQALWQEGRRPEGLERLREAHKLDPRNALVRGELVNALVELARHQVESDWASAQPLVEEILRLEPNHTTAVHLLDQIGRQRREETVAWCLVEVRRLRSKGELEAAYRLVCDSLGQYPDDDRLLQLEDSLAQDLDPSLVRSIPTEQPEGSADPGFYADNAEAAVAESYQDESGEWTQDPEGYAEEYAAEAGESELGYEQVSEDAETPISAEAALEGEVYQDSEGAEGAYADPAAFAGDVDEVSAELGAYQGYESDEVDGFPESDSLIAAEQGVSPDASLLLQQEGAADAETQEDLLSRLAHESAGTPQQPRNKQKQPGAKDAKGSALTSLKQKCATLVEGLRRRLAAKDFQAVGRTWPTMPTLLGVAAIIALLGIGGTALIWQLTSGEEPAPAVVGLPVTIQSSPPGATLTVDGQVCGVSPCQIELAAESHRVEASLAGYHAAAVSFDVNEQNAGQPVVVTLLPILPLLHVSSDLASGEVTLDGERIGELEDGSFEWEMADISPGQHTLRLSSGRSSADITFELTEGGAPRFTAAPKSTNLKMLALAGLGPVAQVHGTENGSDVSLDGRASGKLGSDAVVLEGLGEGTHELALGSGQNQRAYVFDSGESPLLAVFLNSDRDVGSLRVVTGEDDVQIYLNGTAYRRKTVRGRRLIYLYPKEYEVRVEKEGFRAPAPQMATIKKGEEVQLEFELTPLPQAATLRITNAVPGTEVWIDGQSRGVVRSTSFTLSSLDPGKHVIRLENENYKTAEFEREVGANTTVELDGTLESAVGTLEIQIIPADVDATLTLQREGESASRPIAGRSLKLPPGTYTVQATAPGFHEYAATVRIVIDQTKTASLTLREREPEKTEPALTMADWEKAGFTREEKLLVRRGGDFVVAPNSGGAGRYTFTGLLQRGRRLEWVVNFTDKDNHVFYQLGDDFLHRTEVSNGRKSRTVKIPHKMKWNDFLSVDIIVQPDSIVHRVLIDNQWVELDNWRQPGGNLTAGKFGFHLARRDQIALSHFVFVPER